MNLPPFRWAMAAVLACATLLVAAPAAADTWDPPGTETTVSANGDYRFVMEPRALSGTSEYWRDAGRDLPLPGQRPGGIERPRGTLQRRGGPGDAWTDLWQADLVNDVAPVSALVADDGSAVVTFDNWHALGAGDDALVIYGPAGNVVRQFALVDFLPEDYLMAMPASVSSLFWRHDEGLSADGRFVWLGITIPDRRFFEEGDAADDFLDEFDEGNVPTVRWQIALASGEAAPVSAREWAAAQASAAPAIALIKAEFARLEAEEAAPLPYPADGEKLTQFLHRAFERLDPDGDDVFPTVYVLCAAASCERGRSEGWIRKNLLATDQATHPLMLAASENSSELADLIVATLAEVAPGSLGGRRVYVVVGVVDSMRVEAALIRAGAEYRQIGPAVPIPPRAVSANAEP